MKRADFNLSIGQGRRRILELEGGDIGLVNQDLAAGGGSASSRELYAPGFRDFVGQLSADTSGGATTLVVRLTPRIVGSLGGGGLIASSQFVLATITTGAGIFRHVFAWGASRGAITSTSGHVYTFSPIFTLEVINSGATNPANAVTIEAIVCQ